MVWNKTVFDIETVLMLNWTVRKRTTLTKTIFILNWIVWIRTVSLNWTPWKRNVFEN